MKRKLLILILGIFIIVAFWPREANSGLVGICRVSPDTIKLNYGTSMYGIIKIKQMPADNDTLELKVFISLNWWKQKEFYIPIKKDLQFIKIGKSKIEVKKLQLCSEIYSGEDAMNELKKMKNSK